MLCETRVVFRTGSIDSAIQLTTPACFQFYVCIPVSILIRYLTECVKTNSSPRTVFDIATLRNQFFIRFIQAYIYIRECEENLKTMIDVSCALEGHNVDRLWTPNANDCMRDQYIQSI